MAKDINSVIHDLLLEKTFTPENAAASKGAAGPEPYLYKKGDRVTFVNPRFTDQDDWQDEFEILGFLNGGNVVDENTASPYDKTYGIKLKNIKSGKEINTPASYLKIYGGK